MECCAPCLCSRIQSIPSFSLHAWPAVAKGHGEGSLQAVEKLFCVVCEKALDQTVNRETWTHFKGRCAKCSLDLRNIRKAIDYAEESEAERVTRSGPWLIKTPKQSAKTRVWFFVLFMSSCRVVHSFLVNSEQAVKSQETTAPLCVRTQISSA